MKLNFPPLCLSCPQWWSGPLVRPLPSGYGISELGGGAHYRRYKEKILHQRLQVAGADGRSVCMLVFVTNSSRIFFYKFNFARNLHPWKWIQADHVLTLCDRFVEVSLQCSVLSEGWRWICESGAVGVWSDVGHECPEAAVHQRPGLSWWKAQQEQHHPLQVWQR